jgi:hypothetical protein
MSVLPLLQPLAHPRDEHRRDELRRDEQRRDAPLRDGPPRDASDPDALDSYEIEADLILRAMELASEQPHGFGVDDLERVEAYWSQLEVELSFLGCVVSLTDGRRFHLLYICGEEPEDEPGDALPGPETVQVTQMMTTEDLPPQEEPPWIHDVADINAWLRLPPVVDAAPPATET